MQDEWQCRSCQAIFLTSNEEIFLPQCPLCHDYGRKLSPVDILIRRIKDAFEVLLGNASIKRVKT